MSPLHDDLREKQRITIISKHSVLVYREIILNCKKAKSLGFLTEAETTNFQIKMER